MASRVIIDDFLIQQRAALLVDGKPQRFAISGMTRGPVAGARFMAKLGKLSGQDWMAQTDQGFEVHISARRAKQLRGLSEGRKIPIEITRAAGGDKAPEAKVVNPDTPLRPNWDEIDAFLAALPEHFDGPIHIGTPALWNARAATWKSAFAHLAPHFEQHFGAPGEMFETADCEDVLAHLSQHRWPIGNKQRLDFASVHGITVIDVNAGAQNNRLSTNIAAAQALPHLITLAQLGGLMVVDFIDLERRADKQAVLAALDDALASSAIEARRTGWSQFGLVELQMKRAGPSLPEALHRDNHAALKGPQLVCSAYKTAIAGQPKPLSIAAEPAVAKWLIQQGSEAVLSDRLHMPITITQRDPLS
ncbi:MAG: ribonuclease E/G [Pseudomonadota bacterium]